MPEAILIAGNSARFTDTRSEMREYLRNYVQMPRKRIVEYETAYMNEGMLAARLEMAASAKTSASLLIYYSGHGSETSWALDDDRRLSYMELGKIVAGRRRPITVVNDTCYGMAAADGFSKDDYVHCLGYPDRTLGARLKKVCVVAASEVDGLTNTSFTCWLINAWMQRKPTRIPESLRWGASHDHFYFPKPKAAPAPEPPLDEKEADPPF